MNTRQVLQSRFQPTAPKAAKFTIWHNPLTTMQRVDVWEGEDFIRYEVPPGGTERIPSRHDAAIHRVQCSEDSCRAKGGFCTEGHPGVVHGGIAPQLQRKGQEEDFVLAKGLDTEAEKRGEAELQAVAAAEKVRRAEVDSIMAQKRADELKAQAEKPVGQKK